MKLWPFPKCAPQAPASAVPAAAPASPVPSPVPAEPACVAAEAAPTPELAPPCPSKPEPAPQTAEEQPQPARVLSAGEAAQYREFLRRKREEELSFMLRRLIADLTSVSDGACLCAGVEDAVRLGASGVLVTPDQLSFVRKQLKSGGKGAQRGAQNSADAPRLFVLVGGTGDTLPSVKKCEAKKAVRLGADALVFLPSVMLFRGYTAQASRREWRPVLRAAGRTEVFVALTDPRLKREEVLSGVRAAQKARAFGVVVGGEPETAAAAAKAAGQLSVCADGAENGGQLDLLLKAGAGYVLTRQTGRIAKELELQAKESLGG